MFDFTNLISFSLIVSDSLHFFLAFLQSLILLSS